MYALVHKDFQNLVRNVKNPSNSRRFIGEGDPKRYFCTFGEKEQTSKRQTNVLKLVCLVKSKICDAYAPSHEPVKNPVRGPHKILCTCGAKWHQNSAVLGELYLSTQKGAFLLVFYSVQRTLCHSEELHCNDVRIPRKGTILQNPRKILLYLRAAKNAPWKRCVFDWFNN